MKDTLTPGEVTYTTIKSGACGTVFEKSQEEGWFAEFNEEGTLTILKVDMVNIFTANVCEYALPAIN